MSQTDSFQICVNVSNGWKTFWDDNSTTPYAVQGAKVITYDDERSIAEKVNYLTVDIIVRQYSCLKLIISVM
jgi:GH18 family chitinase